MSQPPKSGSKTVPPAEGRRGPPLRSGFSLILFFPHKEVGLLSSLYEAEIVDWLSMVPKSLDIFPFVPFQQTGASRSSMTAGAKLLDV